VGADESSIVSEDGGLKHGRHQEGRDVVDVTCSHQKRRRRRRRRRSQD